MTREKLLVVVDMQKDFVDGALGTKEAVAVVDSVVKVIEGFEGRIVATRDTHTEDYLNTQEGRKLPVVHCVKGSEGWQLDKRVAKALEGKNCEYFDKPSFGSPALAEFVREQAPYIEDVTLIGLCTGICVISNAMLIKAYVPELEVKVDSAACACVTPASHATALEAMKLCQIEIL